MRESRSLGSVRGDRGNPVPYREQPVRDDRRGGSCHFIASMSPGRQVWFKNGSVGP